jgi:RHS repeat-associated protein
MANSTQIPSGKPYDAAGDVTYDGSNYYAYDAEGRVCATQTAPYSGGVVAYGYLYDAEGRRVAKGSIAPAPLGQWPSCNPAANGFTLTESYVLGQGGERLTTTSWAYPPTLVPLVAGATPVPVRTLIGTWQGTNVNAGGKLIAAYDAPTSGAAADAGSAGGLHFQLTDPLGTRRVQTNSAGEAELDCQSLPFGDQLNCFPDPNAPGNDQDEDATGMLTGIHFTGKERDTESGLDYFGARYYGSSMGRFLSPDPTFLNIRKVFNPQRWNLYSYGLNNPQTNVDPDGNEVISVVYPNYMANSRGNIPAPTGHAGVVLVEKYGTTHYFEYGPYSNGNQPTSDGAERAAPTPSLQRDAAGNITQDSMNNLLKTLSSSSGKGGVADALVIPTDSTEDDIILTYLKAREAENGDANRQKYSLWGGHNCGTFVCEALDHAGMRSPGSGSRAFALPYANFLMLWALYGGDAWQYQPKEHVTVKIHFNDELIH